MSAADILVALALAIFAMRGWSRGLVVEMMSLTVILASFAAAFQWTGKLVPRIADSVPGPAFFDTGVAFLVLFGLTFVTGRYIATMIRRVWLRAKRSPMNRMAGLSFGVLKGAVVVGCAVLILRNVEPDIRASTPPEKSPHPVSKVQSRVNESRLALRIADLTGGLFSVLMTEVGGRVRELGDTAAEQEP